MREWHKLSLDRLTYKLELLWPFIPKHTHGGDVRSPHSILIGATTFLGGLLMRDHTYERRAQSLLATITSWKERHVQR
jgi:hypothetical protein